jgi:hypothetical protein
VKKNEINISEVHNILLKNTNNNFLQLTKKIPSTIINNLQYIFKQSIYASKDYKKSHNYNQKIKKNFHKIQLKILIYKSQKINKYKVNKPLYLNLMRMLS